MDTAFFRAALEAYRVRSGDRRPWVDLDLRAMSAVLADAQNIKQQADRTDLDSGYNQADVDEPIEED